MITVNGKETEWHEGMTVADLLKAKKYSFPLIIITINGNIVPKAKYPDTKIPDGAEVKANHLISGG